MSETASQNVIMNRLSNTITLYRNSTNTLAGAPKPLLLLLPWFGAKPPAVERYRKIYYPYGFDILTVESSILHFLWPRYGLSYALEVLDLLHSEPFSSRPLVIHAFSIGGFLFVQMIVATLRDVPRYLGFKARIVGQIFDSLVIGDVELMAKGVSQMLAPQFLLPLFRRATLFYFWLLSAYTVRHYQSGIRTFWETPYHSPILVFYSENDPLSSYTEVEALLCTWQRRGIRVLGKSWKISRHAGHLRQHPQEYQSTLQNFLQSLSMIHLPSKL
ncbi:transmembrane protein 53-A [Heterodontus francisci]|uniref:transmembrane protein 53-A n=1 Tax=Heterodontus francisci TaxID=7792 RepID=UPI00355BA3BA